MILKLFLPVAAVCLFAVLPIFAGSWYYDEYSLLIEPAEMPLQGKIYGYEDIAFKLYNQSPVQRSVKIKLSSYKSSSQLQSISKSVVLDAGSRDIVIFSKPYLIMNNIEVRVWIDNVPQKTYSLKDYIANASEFRYSNPVSILLSERLSYDFFDDLLNSRNKKTYLDNTLNIYRSEKLPETANAYSGFDSILLTAEQVENCTPTARQTLYNYIRSGGSLFIAGSFEPDITAVRSSIGEDLRFYEYGLGLIVSAKVEKSEDIDKLNWEQISEKLWQNRLFVYRHITPGSNINDWFAVVDVSPIPAKTMVAVIALLVILIGPVNILVLRLLNKNVLLYITIPLISLIGAAIILTFSIRNEGTGNTEKTRSFTVFDQRSGQASTAAVLGYYCPIVPIGELEFEETTQVIPLNLPIYGGNGNKHINLDKGQKLFGSWINSRVPSHFAAIKLTENNKPAVIIEKNADGSFEATNNTEQTIYFLRYKDKFSRVWECEKITPTRTVMLKPLNKPRSSMMLCPIRKMFSNDWLRSGANVFKNPYENLHAGCYIAELSGEIFFEEPANGKIEHENQSSFIYGITGDAK
jgi:hypothetical protein